MIMLHKIYTFHRGNLQSRGTSYKKYKQFWKWRKRLQQLSCLTGWMKDKAEEKQDLFVED